MRHYVVIVTLLLFFNTSSAQQQFYRTDSILVLSGTDTLHLAWSGGLNSALVQNMEINGDGITDLLVFDRTGKILPLIHNGSGGIDGWRPGTSFQSGFPQIDQWMLAADYNCDGLTDIFSYFQGSIRLFKNVTTGQIPAFVMEKSQIISFQAPNNIPIYSSVVDLPAITDVDLDGDLDILTFSVNGKSVEYHKNLSMEQFGSCDSVVFELQTTCWGKFEEGISNNNISLNICPAKKARHSGSTLLALDYDGDLDKDLVLGDVSYPTFSFLRNGGNPATALMDTVIYKYPVTGTEVDLQTFPAGMLADVDNDGIKDFIVSPYAPGISENFTSVWYYKNMSSGVPDFSFIKPNLLQEQMIDLGEGAYPVPVDYDMDGDMDILAGNYGYFTSPGNYSGSLALLINQGTNTNPVYQLASRDYNNLSTFGFRNLYPAFADLDGDGDQDMILGDYNGTLHYFENTAASGNPANFVLQQSNYGGIDVGNFAAPWLADLNGDGKADLIIGEKDGSLNYIPNTGTFASPVHSSANMTTNFGGVIVTIPGFTSGYSTPFLYKDNGTWNLICGSESGHLHHYNNINGNLTGTFNKVSGNFEGIKEGIRSSFFGFADPSGRITALTGNYRGGFSVFRGSGFNSIGEAQSDYKGNLKFFPNPATEKVSIVSSLQEGEISFMDLTGRIVYQNTFSGGEVDTRGLSAGIYLVVLRSKTGTETGKLIIRKN